MCPTRSRQIPSGPGSLQGSTSVNKGGRAKRWPGGGKSRSAGFTLLEMLASLTLVGLLFATLAGGVRFAGRVHDRGQQQITETSGFTLAGDLLRRQVGRAFPLVAGYGPAARFVFTGERQRLAFPILGRPGRERGELRLAAFTVEQHAGGSRLIYREHRLATVPGLDVVEPAEHTAVLLDGPWRLAFAYHGTAPQAPSWQERWTAPRDLPSLVRLTAHDAAGRPAWPELVARARIDGDRGCLSGPALPCRGSGS
ncbi:MAG TPA: prepilin-type N-terminal cleavage/methylation domain-containing protein [Azospirillum sp.]|nr:prepilin-type N-terminal cleavage/methylation domain-containing protein [Azospirillum sp.]